MRRTADTARAVHGRRGTTPPGGTYRPRPADTADVEIPPEISALTERLARNTHENWASQRIALGWRHGPVRDDERKEHPCLVPYDELPEGEKDFDRRTALETVRLILALGYRIVRPRTAARPAPAGERRPAASPSPSRPGCGRRTPS